MAERKAVNKYYPPDWDPRKGSVNKRIGQHPLRDRARKLSQGILVIRFELPYNIWCGGCGNHVGMGVRYNAEKSKVGNYYSTPIYKFRMKCHLCDNYFEIQTDPKNHDYVILSGARRKEQRWDPVANEQVVPEDKATQKKLATDPMYKLEHGSDDHQKGKDKVMNLAQIEDSRMSMRDDYILNRMARDKFRAEKKQLKEAAEADRAILDRCSLDLELVEETEEDKKLADLMKYSVTSSYEDKQKEIRKKIEQRPLFPSEKTTLPLASASSPMSSSSSSPSSVPSLNKQVECPQKGVGNSKKQLGTSLLASLKDPFKTVRKKGKGSLLKSSLNRNQLGIKLLPAKDLKSMTKMVSHTVIGKRQNDKSKLSKKDTPSMQKPDRDAEPQIVDSLRAAKLEICDSSKISPSEPRTLMLSKEQKSEVLSHGLEKSGDTPGSISLHREESHALLTETNGLKSVSHVINDNADGQHSITQDDPKKNQAQNSLQIDLVDQQGSDDSGVVAPPRRHSGLQTLISSYTDSDSDSGS